jgi:hypothetical protein
MGRIFSHWVIVYFGQFCVNFRSSANLWAAVFHFKVYVLILSKNALGNILGDFFASSSGHPVSKAHYVLAYKPCGTVPKNISVDLKSFLSEHYGKKHNHVY